MTVDIRRLTQPDALRVAANFQGEPVFAGQPIRFDQPALVVLAQNGGLVLGAYEGEDLVGLSVSILGTDLSDPRRPAMANLKMVTTFLGEHPETRDQDVAYRLLLQQRAYATQQGIRLITWALDPLNSAYAHLSLHRLGAITDHYVADYYGPNGHPVGATDRLEIEWWVTNRRVEARLGKGRRQLSLRQYIDGNARLVNPSRAADGWPVPDGVQPVAEGTMALLEVPSDIAALREAAPALADSWRVHVREVAFAVLAAGYVITDFVHEEWEGRPRSFYVLSRAPRSFFSLS